MEIVNKVELKVENIEKCVALVCADCPLGSLYDFSCALQSFALQKMKEHEAKKEEKSGE